MTPEVEHNGVVELVQVGIVCGCTSSSSRYDWLPKLGERVGLALPILDPLKTQEERLLKEEGDDDSDNTQTTKRLSRAEDYRHCVAAQDAMTSFAPSATGSPDKPSESRAIRCLSLNAACRCPAINCLPQEHGRPMILRYVGAPHLLASHPYVFSQNATRE